MSHPESMIQLVRGLGIEGRVEDPLRPRVGVQLKLVDWREHLQLHAQQGGGWQTTIKSTSAAYTAVRDALFHKLLATYVVAMLSLSSNTAMHSRFTAQYKGL